MSDKNIFSSYNESNNEEEEKGTERQKINAQRTTIYRPDLSYLTKFSGFFNKKFNLTTYKKEREDSRSRSKSPERKISPHKLKGNGIPVNIIERTRFLANIFKSKKFKNFYFSLKKQKDLNYEQFIEKILNFSKKNSPLEGVMMAYFYICHEIHYDYNFGKRKDNYKKFQQAPNVFKNKRALSLGYTNLFEALLKKLEIKYKHIEGFCKYMPSTNDNLSGNEEQTTQSIIFSNRNFSNLSVKTQRNYNTFYSVNSDSTNDIYDLTNYTNHCWNAIHYKNEWYFVDIVLGSCSFDKQKVKSKKDFEVNLQFESNMDEKLFYENFNPFYFMTPPQLLINSHLPLDESWQMTNKILNLKQFLAKKLINNDTFYKALYYYDLELLSHKTTYIQINIKENLAIQFKLPSYVIYPNLYDSTGLNKLNDVKYSSDPETSIYTLEPVFPKVGEYFIKINVRAINSTDITNHYLLDYQIKVISPTNFVYFEKYIKQSRLINDKIGDGILLPKLGLYNKNKANSINKRFSSMNYNSRIIPDYTKIFRTKTNKLICYDNEGFALLEPRTPFTKPGAVTNFKIKLKGAMAAFVLDGNKITPLKKIDENIYEGQKEIKSDNVSICCMKNSNVLTEVIRFNTRKKIYLSNSLRFKIKDIKTKRKIEK